MSNSNIFGFINILNIYTHEGSQNKFHYVSIIRIFISAFTHLRSGQVINSSARPLGMGKIHVAFAQKPNCSGYKVVAKCSVVMYGNLLKCNNK